MIPRHYDSPILKSPNVWRFCYDAVFLFELDVSAIRLQLPKGAYPTEVRPNVTLFGISYEVAEPGNLGYLPAFTEINWCFALETDLSRDMPTPRFSMYTGGVGSDCAAFLDAASEIDKMPVYRHRALRTSVVMEEHAVSAADEDGPIFSLRSSHRRPPVYETRTHWVQPLSEQGGRWFQALSWNGDVFEHQEGHSVGVVHPHPFFEGVDRANTSRARRRGWSRRCART